MGYTREYNVRIMIQHIFSYILTFIVFLGIDLTWLGYLAKDFYRKQFGSLLAESFDLTAAFIFYALFVLGLYIFVIVPNASKADLFKTLYMGALFGFFTYMTYDLTNKATLAGWSWTLTFADILWGVVLSTLVSFAGYYIYQLIH